MNKYWMMRKLTFYIWMALLMVLAGCSGLLKQPSGSVEQPSSVAEQPSIYPDYVGVTIAVGIAPLNFNAADEQVDLLDVVVRGRKGGEMHVQGDVADFDIDEWHRLTALNRGADLVFTVCMRKDGRWSQYRDFRVHVSPFALTDYGVTYRRIAPGYEVGGNIGIYQRDIHTFKEYAILQESALPGRCFNCHTPNRTDPSAFTLQIRGEGGGTLVQKDGQQVWLNTKTDSTKAAGSYAYWHPAGRYCAYATNSVHQSFFVGKGQRIEAYHEFSNIVVLDTRTNELILSPLLQTDWLEIFPAFSGDGRYLYYSTSPHCSVPAEYEKVKCSLCRIPFDARTGRFGEQVDTLLNGPALDKSFTLARPSYDGRWLMYCQSSRSNFPVCHKDADLWLIDLQTGRARSLDEANSDDTESYHNWSSDSHWFVFSSKRDDGMYARLYFACIDQQGRVGKPFMLPQRHPRDYYAAMFDSYNCPDFTRVKVSFDVRKARREVFSDKRVQVGVRK